MLGSVDFCSIGTDRVVGPDGGVAVVGQSRINGRYDYADGRRIESLETDGSIDLTPLLGVGLQSGFRSQVQALPLIAGGLDHQMLDDLPTTALVGGYAVGVAGERIVRTLPLGRYADLCAGFAVDGTMLSEERKTGRQSMSPGPPGPDHAAVTDERAAHAVQQLGPHGMHRLRVIDCWTAGDVVGIEHYFRDHHVDADRAISVVHEYTVRAEWDPQSDTFVSASAIAHVLPWFECASAANSAHRLVGRSAAGLRGAVQRSFIGTSTCTHLNDTLRALADVPYLVALAHGGVHDVRPTPQTLLVPGESEFVT